MDCMAHTADGEEKGTVIGQYEPVHLRQVRLSMAGLVSAMDFR